MVISTEVTLCAKCDAKPIVSMLLLQEYPALGNS